MIPITRVTLRKPFPNSSYGFVTLSAVAAEFSCQLSAGRQNRRGALLQTAKPWRGLLGAPRTTTRPATPPKSMGIICFQVIIRAHTRIQRAGTEQAITSSLNEGIPDRNGHGGLLVLTFS